MSAPESEVLDAEEFRRLVTGHAAELTRYATGLLGGDGEGAREVVQDAFVRLWQNPPSDHRHLRAWLFKVCRSRAVDRLRRSNRFVSDDGAMGERVADDTAGPDRALDAKESHAALAALVDTLPARQREIVRLKFRENLSYAEIGEITGLTATNVGFLLCTALKTLRGLAARRPELNP